MRRTSALVLLLLCLSAITFWFLGRVGDKHFTGIPGITPDRQPVPTRPCEEFYPLIASVFPKLDRDGHGYITMQDIDRAVLVERTISGDEAAAVYALRQAFDMLAVRGKDGHLHVGHTELKLFHSALPALPAKTVDEHMEHARNFLKKVNRGLYPSGTMQQSVEKMRSIHQLHRGNCYFESGCGSMAAVNPATVRSMITDNGVDGRGVRTFSVRFLRAPDEEYVVDELTDMSMLVNDVDEDSGIWMTVLTRAYGMYQLEHPWVRLIQRLYWGLNESILPEDITDQGSMSSDGLRMCTPPDTRVKQVMWGVDKGLIVRYGGDALIEFVQHAIKELSKPGYGMVGKVLSKDQCKELLVFFKGVDQTKLRDPLAKQLSVYVELVLKAVWFEKRDPAVAHERLSRWVCQENLPATVFKYGGSHEASIVKYTVGTVSSDGKHTSQYGFVTIHDQAGLSEAENAKVRSGEWWRDPGMDDQTLCMSMEEFTKFYTGYACVMRR